MNEEELACLEAEGAAAQNDAEVQAQCEEMYADVVEEVHDLVGAVSKVINEHDILKNKNFSLYYQHGRLGYMDLDMFAEKIKIAEKQKDIDRSEN